MLQDHTDLAVRRESNYQQARADFAMSVLEYQTAILDNKPATVILRAKQHMIRCEAELMTARELSKG